MSNKDNLVLGFCPECREPVLKTEDHKFELRKYPVVLHWPKCPIPRKSTRMKVQ